MRQEELDFWVLRRIDYGERLPKLLLVDAVNDQGFLVVFYFLCELEAVVIDSAVRLEQLENGFLVQVVDLSADEGKELRLHLADALLEHFVSFHHSLVLRVLKQRQFDFEEPSRQDRPLGALLVNEIGPR